MELIKKKLIRWEIPQKPQTQKCEQFSLLNNPLHLK